MKLERDDPARDQGQSLLERKDHEIKAQPFEPPPLLARVDPFHTGTVAPIGSDSVSFLSKRWYTVTRTRISLVLSDFRHESRVQTLCPLRCSLLLLLLAPPRCCPLGLLLIELDW